MDEKVTTSEPSTLRFTSRYIRKLIIEAPYIYARLYNPSGSIVLRQSSMPTYSTSIGNSFHNDLIDVSIILKEKFTKEELRLIYDWASGLNSKQAAMYYDVTDNVVRKRRQRAVNKLRKEIDGQQQDDRRDGD